MNRVEKAVLVLDCGATNVRAIAVGRKGQILASHSQPNNTVADPNYEGGLIWDVEEIWKKLALCARSTLEGLGHVEIGAVTVTTFGVDGAPIRKDGSMLYPVISWQCNRTIEVMDSIGRYMEVGRLCRITGLNTYHFNTINKLIWLKENRPDVIEAMDYYLLIPSYFLYKLTGEFVTDVTMAGTTMLTELKTRSFSDEVFSSIGLKKEIFPNWVEAGTVIGKVTSAAASGLGIKAGIPVVAAGHDTQFAVFGSGAGTNEPVLSSGTWEILMARTQSKSLDLAGIGSGITVELDAEPGLVDLGVQWVASGALEWIGKLFYNELIDDSLKYEKMISEARKVPPGCEGITIIPELFGQGFSGKPGSISGLRHNIGRGHFYRATLEALSYYTRRGLEMLENAGGFKADSIICVGGGTKNLLWNQIKADVLGIPVKVSHRKETTVLGAALFAMPAAGMYPDLKEACMDVSAALEVFLPGKETDAYDKFYHTYASDTFSD